MNLYANEVTGKYEKQGKYSLYFTGLPFDS